MVKTCTITVKAWTWYSDISVICLYSYISRISLKERFFCKHESKKIIFQGYSEFKTNSGQYDWEKFNSHS